MRILLDTNVWRYIVDSGRLATLKQVAEKSRIFVVIAPAVLYEAAQTGDPVVRRTLLSALTLPTWKRLMPEAYSEAEEIRLEVRRLQPDWLRPKPNMVYFNQLRYDWKRSRRGAWDRAASDPGLIRELQGPVMELARQQASDHRQEAVDWSPKWAAVSLNAIRVVPLKEIPGWAGDKVEPWRIEGLDVLIRALRTKGHATRDWLMGELDLDAMLYQREELTSGLLQKF